MNRLRRGFAQGISSWHTLNKQAYYNNHIYCNQNIKLQPLLLFKGKTHNYHC